MRITWAVLAMAACSDDPFPPAFYDSPSFGYPIAVSDSALYYVEENQQSFVRQLAELGLDGVPHGLVAPELAFIDDVKVQGSTIEVVAGRQLVRLRPSGSEMVMLPADSTFNSIVLGPTGTFVTSTPETTPQDPVLPQTVWFWGADADALEQLPIEPGQLSVVAVDATDVYLVRFPDGVLVRFPISGGAEEVIASDVYDAKISDNRLIYASATMLVERSLDDQSERVLGTRSSNNRGFSPIVVAGDVVFWGNLRILNGEVEEFLLPSSIGYLRAVVVNSSDVYWVSTMRADPKLLGQPSDLKLHRAAIHGERPF